MLSTGPAAGLFAIEILVNCPGGGWRTLSEWEALFATAGQFSDGFVLESKFGPCIFSSPGPCWLLKKRALLATFELQCFDCLLSLSHNSESNDEVRHLV